MNINITKEIIDNIYKKYGLYSRCYYLGDKEKMSEYAFNFLILNFKEKDEEKAYKKYKKLYHSDSSLTGKKFICRLYDSDNQKLAYIEYTFLSDKIIYIDGIYKEEDIESSIRKLTLGKILMIQTLIKAYKRGARIASLIALDNGNGKLYSYYYKLGFRCSSSEERDLPIAYQSITTYNDFFSGTDIERANRNLRKCYSMKGDIETIINSFN